MGLCETEEPFWFGVEGRSISSEKIVREREKRVVVGDEMGKEKEARETR